MERGRQWKQNKRVSPKGMRCVGMRAKGEGIKTLGEVGDHFDEESCAGVKKKI